VTFQGDPYRVLGISPGASLNEIRSAYRRLAKQYHPDAAGERALTRFLAIQAAYERLVDGEGQLRPADGRATAGGAAAGGAGSRADGPWQADPARARASRDAWRARRAGQGAGAGPRSRGDAPGRQGTGTRARPGTARGDAADGQDARRAGGRAEGPPPRRGPRKATPGSTTYDEATDGVRDPEWDGGSWYGPSSRTYWTINPREYADPRKHGPEYQERARRAASWPPVDGVDDGSPATSQTAADAHGPEGWGAGSWTYHADAASASAGAASASADASSIRGGGPGAGRSTRPAWPPPADDAPAGAWPSSEPSPTGSRPSRPSATRVAAAAEPLPDLETLARQAAPRHLLALARRPGLRWKLLLAVIGWPPVGLAVGSLLTTVTGCGGFAAACPAPVPAISMATQPLIVASLILVPPAAALAAFGSIAALAVAVPLAAVLSVGTEPGSRAGAAALGVIVLVAYLVALAAGAFSLWRPPREP
jgi:DnaJ domain